tara:strand:+ start:604 stop:1467 length:864 start_codon:yes stop_codon:yes gene_type:complete
MKNIKLSKKPPDSNNRKKGKPVICYPVNDLQNSNFFIYQEARNHITAKSQTIIPPREARCFDVKAGQFFRIESIDGPQVGDLNLFQADNFNEKFYSGKTRALHGTHLSTGDQMWSCFPYLRPLATITWDTLDWYEFDKDGASVHDVIGTRCDPYTAKLLDDHDYHHCCHSNLIRALVNEKKININQAENLVHDVLNVFMCTGFSKDTHQYFMKASPVRPGDFLEFFAETNLVGVLSACPGGDCSSEHSSDNSTCYPLKVSVLSTSSKHLKGWLPSLTSSYNQKHGLK